MVQVGAKIPREQILSALARLETSILRVEGSIEKIEILTSQFSRRILWVAVIVFVISCFMNLVAV